MWDIVREAFTNGSAIAFLVVGFAGGWYVNFRWGKRSRKNKNH